MADHHAELPEEPKTPMWLPALGGALFLLAGIWWVTCPEPANTSAPAPAASAIAATRPGE
ncbi:MAG: hypothetical protein ABI551_09130 [Polyangiaceae bacterium]